MAVLLAAFDDTLGRADHVIRVIAVLGALLNGPYYLLARTGRYPRAQAYVRMAVDLGLITVGLYSAGGLAAAPYLSVYTPVTVYAGITLSRAGALVGTAMATGGYLAVALLQQARWLPLPSAIPPEDAWPVAAFNLLIFVVVSVTTAFLADAHRKSRRQLMGLHQDLERAHDEVLRLNAEMQRLARLHVLGEVVAGVTHEIRNVLTVAFGHLEFATRKVRGVMPDVVRHLDKVSESCEVAMRIVRNALQLGRSTPPERVAVSIPDVAERIAELKTFDLRRHDIDLEIAFPPDFPLVMATSLQILQVLLNLVGNAQDALHETTGRRTITIVGMTEPRRVVVEVRDTGPGIHPEMLPRLFEPFFTMKADGTGLGLAISAGIVRDLGGELTGENLPDGGAAFRVAFPVASAVGHADGGEESRVHLRSGGPP